MINDAVFHQKQKTCMLTEKGQWMKGKEAILNYFPRKCVPFRSKLALNFKRGFSKISTYQIWNQHLKLHWLSQQFHHLPTGSDILYCSEVSYVIHWLSKPIFHSKTTLQGISTNCQQKNDCSFSGCTVNSLSNPSMFPTVLKLTHFFWISWLFLRACFSFKKLFIQKQFYHLPEHWHKIIRARPRHCRFGYWCNRDVLLPYPRLA